MPKPYSQMTRAELLAAIEALTQRDAAAAQQTAVRVGQLAATTERVRARLRWGEYRRDVVVDAEGCATTRAEAPEAPAYRPSLSAAFAMRKFAVGAIW